MENYFLMQKNFEFPLKLLSNMFDINRIKAKSLKT